MPLVDLTSIKNAVIADHGLLYPNMNTYHYTKPTFIDKMSWIVWIPFFLISMTCFFLACSVLLTRKGEIEKQLEESRKKVKYGSKLDYIGIFFDLISLQMLEHKILRYIIYAIAPMGLLLVFYYGL